MFDSASNASFIKSIIEFPTIICGSPNTKSTNRAVVGRHGPTLGQNQAHRIREVF